MEDEILGGFVLSRNMDDTSKAQFYKDYYSSSKQEQNSFLKKVKYGMKKMQDGGDNRIMQLISAYAQLVGINPQEVADKFQQLQPQEQQQALQEMQQALQQEPQEQEASSNTQEEVQEQAQYGIIKKSKNGLYDYPMQPVVVPTENSGKITMKKIPYKVDAYNNQTGEYLQTMQPEQEYRFHGVDEVLEIPKMQAGGTRVGVANDNNLFVDSKGQYFINKNTGEKVYINLPLNYNDKIFKAKDEIPEVVVKGKKQPMINYLTEQKQEPKKLPSAFIKEPVAVNTDTEKGSTANLIEKGSNYSYTPNEGIFSKANVDPRGYTTSTKQSSLWDNSKGSYEDWVKGWNTLIPGFDKLPISEKQSAAYQYVEKNKPELINKMWTVFGNTKARKGSGTLADFIDGSIGGRNQMLDPKLFQNNSIQINGIKPLNQHLTDPHIKTPVIDILKKATIHTKPDKVLNELGTLTNKDYLGLPLSNAYNRAMQTYLPYYKQAQFKPLQAIGVDPRAALAQVDAQSNAALQGINQNSTVGQSVVQQILANTQRNKQQILSQYDNQNQQIFQNVENQNTQGITNTLNQQENNKYQYHDDLSRIKALQDETLFNLDISAANNQAQLDRTANDFILNDISNPNFQLKKRGNNYDVTQVDTADFKTQDTATKDWIKDLIKENEALKKKVTAKYGMKKKKC